MLSTFGALSRMGSAGSAGSAGSGFEDALAENVVLDWSPGIFRVLHALGQLEVRNYMACFNGGVPLGLSTKNGGIPGIPHKKW